MKFKFKRILALVCCMLLVVTGVSVSNLVENEVQAAYTEISISSVNRPFQKDGKILNITGVSGITGFTAEGSNFLTEEFASEWMTFGGGLTYNELVTGLRKAVVATSSIIQFNWNHNTSPRTEGFIAGTSFTIKQGAPLPYNGAGAYVQLDADYTFTFQEPTDATWYNNVVITKQKTRTVSLGGNTQITYSAGGSNFNFDRDNTTSDAASGDYYIVDYRNNVLDASYDEYIDFAGISLAELKDTYQMRIKFSPTAKCLQIVSWGTVGKEIQVGESIIFRKGMPIKYKNAAGEDIVAYLDHTYEYRCASVNGELPSIFNLYILEEYGLSGQTYVSTSANDKYVDFFCNSDSFSGTTAQIQIRYDDPEIMKNYFEVSGKTNDELVSNGYVLRAYRLSDSFKRLRFSYSTLGLDDGDTVLFKKGFPVNYTTTAGKARIDILDKDYGYVYDADTNTFTYDPSIVSTDQPSVPTKCSVTIHVDGEEKLRTECESGTQIDLNQYVEFATDKVMYIKVNGQYTDERNITISGDTAVVVESAIIIGLDVKNATTSAVDNKQSLNVNIIDAPFEFKGNYGVMLHLDTVASTFIDCSGCQNADVVKANTEVKFELASASLQVIQIRFLQDAIDNLQLGDKIVLKKGMPIPYDAEDTEKRAFLAQDYTFYVNDIDAAGQVTLGPTYVEPKEPIPFGLIVNEVETRAEADVQFANFDILDKFTFVNARYLTLTTDAAATPYIDYSKCEHETDIKDNTEIRFILASADLQVIQFRFASEAVEKLQEGDEITLKQGMPVAYDKEDATQKAILDVDYTFVVKKVENGVVTLGPANMKYLVSITVDGVEIVNEAYEEGTILDLSQYADSSKGKVLSIKVNGEATQEQKHVVSKKADIVIENRSDLCIVVFKDGDEVCVVKEYLLTEKNPEVPPAPDKDGFDDSWEAFELQNGVITVQAKHVKRVEKPTVSLSQAGNTNYQSGASGKISPTTGDTTSTVVWMFIGVSAIAVVCMLIYKRRLGGKHE